MTYLQREDTLRNLSRKYDEIEEALTELRGAQGMEEGQVRELYSLLVARELLMCASTIWVRIVQSTGHLAAAKGLLDDPKTKDVLQVRLY